MKKCLLSISILFILTACGNNDALSEDFRKDVEQVKPIIENTHEDQEEYSEQESELLEKFHDKYKRGQYYLDDKEDYYEMNDIEKAIFSKLNTMRLYAVEMSDKEETATLSSEEDSKSDPYGESEEELSKLMKIDNVADLPEEYKDKHPTYEVTDRIYPEHFKEDVKELLDLYDPIINGSRSNVNNKEWDPLEDFLSKYKNEEIFPTEYKHNDKYYLINDTMRDAIRLFSDLKTDINTGNLTQTTVEDFNFIQENIDNY